VTDGRILRSPPTEQAARIPDGLRICWAMHEPDNWIAGTVGIRQRSRVIADLRPDGRRRTLRA
jgi:hypothetical protein